MGTDRVITATRDIAAPAEEVFELIASPARQPEWDGNDNLVASESPRVTGTGQVFTMRNTSGKVKENHVVVFTEGRSIGWLPVDAGRTPPPGHLWRWDIEPLAEDSCRVTHTYDWTRLTEEARMVRARAMTPEKLLASIDRLATLAEG